MLKVNEFDLKTGKVLREYDPERQGQKIKSRDVEHSYLEHWLTIHGLLKTPLWTARFYPGVTAADQAQLELENKVLVFSNGQQGYFTDAETAQLMTQGDVRRGIAPLYAAGQNAAHDSVAYGSLVISAGVSSALLSGAGWDESAAGSQSKVKPIRLLVIDDQYPGFTPVTLLDRDGGLLPSKAFSALLNRIGDGSMLVSPQVVLALAQPKELEHLIERSLDTSELSSALTAQLVQEFLEHQEISTHLVSEAIAKQLNQLIHNHLTQTVSQFRAATPELPGILKGTLSASQLVEQLGVDAIASTSCIKGDDGQLSSPGIHHLRELWFNRKLDGRYNSQAVGTQLKGTIPQATATELNPRTLKKAQELAQAVEEVQNLAQHYLQIQEERLGDAVFLEGEKDWLSQILEQDQYGVMLGGFPTVVDKLERFIRHERIDLALRGLRIPSAMAQHHGALKPWEICNRDLPAGAIVAYYRSPVPNVGAVAIAINNPHLLRQADREAYEKRGVSYLNPWTAKTVVITDFDGDINAYFVGYLPTGKNLPDWFRQQLQETQAEPPEQQYEKARQLFAGLIEQLNQGDGTAPIQPGNYPQTVTEFIKQTAPERKPPAIAKQAKLKHPSRENETLAQATWRAWSITAENPIGRVANAGMVLQSFASECLYARKEQTKETVLRQIASHYRTLLKREAQGKLVIPSNEAMKALGLPAYNLRERVQALANSSDALARIVESGEKVDFISNQLQLAHDLLSDVANGPNAANLQTAVDGAKSARSINERMHQLALALQYKPHLLRQHRKDPNVYVGARPMPTNTDEPIGWMVEAVNEQYEDTSLYRADNVGMRFGSLLDGIDFSATQKADAERIVLTYLKLMSERSQAQRQLSSNATANRQPSLVLTSAQTGRSLVIERLIDGTTGHEAAVQDLWRSNGPTNWKVLIEPSHQHNQRTFTAKRSVEGQPPHLLGWVSKADVQQHQLEQFFNARQQLWIEGPTVEICPPLALANDVEEKVDRMVRFLQETKAAIPASEHSAYAAAMWSLKLATGEQLQSRQGQRLEKRAKLGMGVALQLFPQMVAERLKNLSPLKLSGFRYRELTLEPGEYQVQTQAYKYLDKAGYLQQVVGIALIEKEGGLKHLGYLGDRTLQLPIGLKLKVNLSIETSPSKGNREQASLRINELLDQASSIAHSQFPKPQLNDMSRLYAPTYQELKDWWRAARGQRDTDKTAFISQLGQSLIGTYREVQTMPRAPSSPEAGYRSIHVVLNSQQHQQMRADQAHYQNHQTCLSQVKTQKNIAIYSGKPYDNAR